MDGNRPSRLGTLSACSCSFKDLPSSCHVSRQRDPHCPEGLEWHLQSRWGLLFGRTLPRWGHNQAQFVKVTLETWTWNVNLICDRLWLLIGYYNLPDGIVISVPVTFTGGKWSVLFDATVGDELKERLQLSARELRQVCQVSCTTHFLQHVTTLTWWLMLLTVVFLSQEKELAQWVKKTVDQTDKTGRFAYWQCSLKTGYKLVKVLKGNTPDKWVCFSLFFYSLTFTCGVAVLFLPV